jgi:hypothetical protein
MDYDIISADENIGQIEVAYKDDTGKCVGVYAIDVPIVDGMFIVGDALHQEIVHRAPLWLIERKNLLASTPNFEDIKRLVGTTVAAEKSVVTPSNVGNVAMWEQLEFDRRVATSLIKFGLLRTDPTAIPFDKL